MASKAEEITAIRENIEAEGAAIRELKAAKAAKEAILARVNQLLELKTQYKALTGEEYKPPVTAAAAPIVAKDGAAQSNNSSSSNNNNNSGNKKAKKDESSKPPTTTTAAAEGDKQQRPQSDLVLHLTGGSSSTYSDLDLKCVLMAQLFNVADITLQFAIPAAATATTKAAASTSATSTAAAAAERNSVAQLAPYYPALHDTRSGLLLFGANAVCRYFATTTTATTTTTTSATTDSSLQQHQQWKKEEQLLVQELLDTEEVALYPLLKKAKRAAFTEADAVVLQLVLLKLSEKFAALAAAGDACRFASFALAPTLRSALVLLPQQQQQQQQLVMLQAAVDTALASAEHAAAVQKLAAANLSTTADAVGGKGAKKKKGKDDTTAITSAASVGTQFNNDDVVKPSLGSVDWESIGLMSGLSLIFTAALKAAFPQLLLPDSATVATTADTATTTTTAAATAAVHLEAVVMRCANPSFGDFQCNNAMAVGKALKSIPNYCGPVSPRDVAARILCAVPENPIVHSCTCAPNGFINITLRQQMLTSAIASLVLRGVRPPPLPSKRVLVDFSSPNIAKEMHVGHLRSTIIGDALCRVLEFLNFDVLRVNHVGDWGTQFGMLIAYLQEAYPDLLISPPNISDLTAIYKQSKKRFDEDAVFKETARQNVVKLQSGDSTCRRIWQLLCDISRAEFQRVYDALQVRLEEVGESHYNPMIPDTIAELQARGMVQEDEGMLVVRMPHFTIPLIVRKSDGGYGYDSTDMAALRYRTQTLQREWIVVITDAGQANHFHMCFDVAREMGWLPQHSHRVDHIGFGVVQGEDGKRFKTRSSETVRLIDLLDAARDRMRASLQQRASEGKSSLINEEIETAAVVIGYGAVKYFDLKQHPATNYVFSYDRMLDTKGDTAVYLLFAYARLVSILRKAEEERGVDLCSIESSASEIIDLSHPAERALAFELLQFGDVIQSVVRDLLPNRLCDYLKEVAVKGTDFVTKCHVLNAPAAAAMHSRLLLCRATQKIMHCCFSLLGIGTLDRI